MKLVTGLAARALGAAGGVPLTVWLLILAILWGLAGHGRARHLRTEVAELQLAAARADRDAALRAEGQGRRAAAAEAQYLAQRAAEERSHAEDQAALRRALSGPPKACPERVGDVVVPAAAVSVLRAAAGDAPSGARGAAGSPGR